MTTGVVWFLAACNNGQTALDQDVKQDDEQESGRIRVESVEPMTGAQNPRVTPPAGGLSLGPGIRRLVDIAVKDLAERIGVEQADIKVLQAEFVSWRDSSAGCPKPGYEYMQVITNGSRIVLSAGDRDYHYHSGGNRAPFLCENPSPIGPLPYALGEA